MREIVAAYPFLSAICRMYRVRVIVDANVVLSDLRWLARRKNPLARTNFQEVLAAGTVVAFAPPKLETEVRRHMPRVAREAKLTVAQLEAEWEIYRRAIRFRAPAEGEKPARVQDPDDLPYVYLRAELGAEAIYTSDTDLKAMGAPVIGADIVVALRDYSRAASIVVSVNVGGTVVFVAGAAVVSKVWDLLQQFIAAFSRLPRGVKLALAGAVLVMMVHPGSRNVLRALTSAIPARAGATLRLLAPLLGESFDNAAQAKRNADAALASVVPALGITEPQPLRVFALRVLLQKQKPMHVDEIARLVLQDGYVTRAKTFHRYLARVLASNPDFTRRGDGLWTLSAAAYAQDPS
jgi:predicted nucleic acid-binding protein